MFEALQDYVVFLDRLLAAVITPANSELVVLLTEPGRVAVAAGLSELVDQSRRCTLTFMERDRRGPHHPSHTRCTLSRELPGAALTSLFKPEFVQRYRSGSRNLRAAVDRPSVARGQPLDQR